MKLRSDIFETLGNIRSQLHESANYSSNVATMSPESRRDVATMSSPVAKDVSCLVSDSDVDDAVSAAATVASLPASGGEPPSDTSTPASRPQGSPPKASPPIAGHASPQAEINGRDVYRANALVRIWNEHRGRLPESAPADKELMRLINVALDDRPDRSTAAYWTKTIK